MIVTSDDQRNTRPRRRWARPTALAVSIAAALMLSACGEAGSGSAATGSTAAPANGPTSTASPAETDRAFLAGMVPHHAAAVTMSQVELARGSNPQVKALAQAIGSSQQREIGEMTQIAQRLYHFTPSTLWDKPMGAVMGQPIMMNMAAMGPMLAQVPPAQVDHEFLTMMIPHHASAVVMGNQEVMTGTDPQLKQLGASVVASQSREIGQMQAMLASGV